MRDPAGTTFLTERGADGVKVGIGPGGGCTTRITTSFGVPQVQALVECRLAVQRSGVPIIADGGIKRHGALAEALLLGGDCAMLGSAFAGTDEAPGEVVHKSVVLPAVAEDRQGPFRCCAAWPPSKRSAPPRRRGSGHARARGYRRGRHGDQCPARARRETVVPT